MRKLIIFAFVGILFAHTGAFAAPNCISGTCSGLNWNNGNQCFQGCIGTCTCGRKGTYDCCGSGEMFDPIEEEDCEEGKYGTDGNCHDCPDADFFRDSARTTEASAAYGDISSNVGFNDTETACYAHGSQTFYDTKGTFTFGGTDCYYNTYAIAE